MNLTFAGINYLAVAAAALATFFLGAIWYQALFGKLWVSLHGYTPEKIAELQKAKPPAFFFGGMIVAYFILAFVMALMMVNFKIDSLSVGVIFGFLLWLGPALAIGFTAYLAGDKPIGIFYIDTTYQLTFLLMMGAILGAWR